MVWALGQIIAQGRPDADWEAQSEANTLCKIIWDALAVCIFLWKRVRSAWLVWQERELLISRHIYLSYKKLKKSFAIFSEFKTFRYIWLCRPSCSLGIYKKFLVTLLFQSLVLRVKKRDWEPSSFDMGDTLRNNAFSPFSSRVEIVKTAPQEKKMAYAIIKRCGRVLWFILFEIQLGTFVFFQLMGLANSRWLHSDLEHVAIVLFFFLYFIIVSALSEFLLLVGTRTDGFILPQLFFGWKLYIGFVFVPNVMGIFGGIAVYKAEDLQTSGINSLTLTVCATPILLLLLLITADDSFSSRNHRDLVRNLSILMVSDLIDGIEMLDSTLKGNSYGIHKSFLTLGAVMIIVLSSFQMAEYKFVRGELMEQPIYTTTVIRHICVIILNLAFLIVRVKVSRSLLMVFKNCMAIILSVIQIFYLTQHTWNLYDLN